MSDIANKIADALNERYCHLLWGLFYQLKNPKKYRLTVQLRKRYDAQITTK